MTISHSGTDPMAATPPSGAVVLVDEALRLTAIERLLGPPGGRGAARALPGRGLPGRGPTGGADSIGRAHAEQFVAFTATNRIKLDAMWAWIDETGRLTATVLAVPNPGRTAIVFASPAKDAEEAAVFARLLEHACGELADIDLAQVLLEPHQAVMREAFVAGGFTFLARLSYMERPLPRRRASRAPVWPDGVTTEPYHDGLHDELVAVLDASYENTLDCPGLRGLRRTEDILAGHQGTGEHDPALWTILRIDGLARGALLLNPSPPSRTIELVYIGLAREARRRGLGAELLRHGLDIVSARSDRAITLAVDETNHPAISLYRGEGFRCVLRRVALIRPLRAEQAGAAGESD